MPATGRLRFDTELNTIRHGETELSSPLRIDSHRNRFFLNFINGRVLAEQAAKKVPGPERDLGEEVGRVLDQVNANNIMVPSMTSKTGWKYTNTEQLQARINARLLQSNRLPRKQKAKAKLQITEVPEIHSREYQTQPVTPVDLPIRKKNKVTVTTKVTPDVTPRHLQ